jgi:hypothetical protein
LSTAIANINAADFGKGVFADSMAITNGVVSGPAAGTTLTFDISHDNTGAGLILAGSEFVYLNGILQFAGNDYTTNPDGDFAGYIDAINFTNYPQALDIIQIAGQKKGA